MKRLPLMLALVALGLYLALPMGRFFSDSHYLLGRVANGAPPYYNVAYLPLGQLADLVLGGWLGTERALEVLSALGVATGVGLTVAIARRLGCGVPGQLTAGALLALAPGALFFAGVIEVHALQLPGAGAAVLLALVAADRRPGQAWALIALAGGVALASHISHALLLPGLLVLAWGREADAVEAGPGGMLERPGRDRRGLALGPAGVPWLLGLAILASGAAVWLAVTDFDTWSVHPGLQWLGTLQVFGERFLSSLGERGPFEPREVLAYLHLELVVPLALLLVGLVAGPILVALREEPTEHGPARRRFALRALVACVPAFLVLPQGGVLEHGGYFLTLGPLLAVLVGLAVDRSIAGGAGRGGAPLVQVAALGLVLAQALLALEVRSAFRERPDARAWSAAAAAVIEPGDSALVSTLARNFALAADESEVHVRDLARDMDMEPDRGRAELLQQVLAGRLSDARFPGDLWFDGELLPSWPESPGEEASAWRSKLHELLATSPAPVEVVGEEPFRLIVVRR